jgi:FHS family Na+ dependent glucose MFS transporter 1
MGVSFSVLGPTLPALAANTRTSLSDISFLFVARSAGSMLGSIGGGRLLDRFKGHRVLAGSLLLLALVSAAVPGISQLWVLTAVMFLSGVVHGLLNVSGNALLVWVHGRGVAPFMNALHFFFGLGTFIAPVLVAQVVLLTSRMEGSYWILGLVTLPLVLAPLWVASPRPESASQQEGKGAVSPWMVAGFFMIFFGYSGAAQAFGGWIFTYLSRLNLANETTAAYLNSIFWGALTAGRLLSIPLALRFNPRDLLRADLIGATISLGVIAVFPTSVPAIAVGSGGLGFCLATIFPTNMSLASRHIPITGKITGVFSIGSSLGALVIPWLIGQFFERLGPQVVIHFNLVNLLVTLGAYFVLMQAIHRSPRLL